MRDRDPRLTQLIPGQTVDVPPAEELERRFARLIPAPTASDPRSPVAPTSAQGPSQPLPPSAPAAVSVPPMTRMPPAAPAPTTPAPERRYRVQVNDTLYGIAKRTLGDGERWSEIYELNRELLQGGTQLQANMLLKMPAGAKLDAPKPQP